MFSYKLSPTRAIASYCPYKQHVFQGSSLNRKFTNEDKAVEKTAKEAIYANDCSGENLSDVWNDQADKPKVRKAGLSNSCLFPMENALRVQRSRRLSARSKYKIRDKIEALYNSSGKANFTFLTLTFVAKVDDKTAQKCLNKFLTVARKKLNNFIYLWVAERQADTKNIHFHLISNRRFPIAYFNSLWVLQQYNCGIQHENYSMETITAHDKAGTMQQILNPVDVKKITSIYGLTGYLTKYVTKNNDEFKCLTWHCSREVSKLFTAQLIHKSDFEQAKQLELNFAVNKSTGEYYERRIIVTDYAIIVTIQNKEHFRKKLTPMSMLNKWILEGMKPDGLPSIDYMDYQTIYLKDEKKVICAN